MCHLISQACSINSNSNKWKNIATHNKDHGTASMKKHVNFEHANAWIWSKAMNQNVVEQKKG